ncbi:hypothetical protein XENOCAPTIV_004628 [Xenoophorus captivus]|uniref:Uncharacterized protein n=1 Tax=Xenoophorus captivus TaxID=1517983 RepID=A0ABV0QGG6_9TELE
MSRPSSARSNHLSSPLQENAASGFLITTCSDPSSWTRPDPDSVRPTASLLISLLRWTGLNPDGLQRLQVSSWTWIISGSPKQLFNIRAAQRVSVSCRKQQPAEMDGQSPCLSTQQKGALPAGHWLPLVLWKPLGSPLEACKSNSDWLWI